MDYAQATLAKKYKAYEKHHHNPEDVKINKGTKTKKHNNKISINEISDKELYNKGCVGMNDYEKVIDKIDKLRLEIKDDINLQSCKINELEKNINDFKSDIFKHTLEQYKFWIGISISVIVSIAGIITTVITSR
ncbi:hypothetical protein [Anaerocolumna xylanovorans]|uniref:Uncharacterized protein n=1 Tax=Anaerocolumna xylanovorans DSM 12503 TaxID=1121345 RepID=A0A1M7YEM4_9FIRM|nr:hypothetical protein [Anaerocolumna xylanovorans]SHO51092.1 hypothetical protein SAMN02745217_03013 [Anaerocolumna xylanovorans DSM 12503]